MIIYISGKMGDLTKEEYQPIFRAAHERLAAEGHKVFNPAVDEWVDWLNLSYERVYGLRVEGYEDILLADLQFLLGIYTANPEETAIYMLSNWQQSNGAQTEHWYAKAIGMRIIYEDPNTKA